MPGPVAASDGNALTRLVTSHPKTAKYATALVGVEATRQVASTIRSVVRNRVAHTVTVGERDQIYPDVHRWLLEISPDKGHRALAVKTNRDFDMSEPVGPGYLSRNKRSSMTLIFDSSRPRLVRVDGHPVLVEVIRPDNAPANERVMIDYSEFEKKIQFTSLTKAGQQAVLKHLTTMAKRQDVSKPRLMMLSKWDDWETRSDLPGRPLSSVVLPPGQKQAIVDDLAAFLDAEEEYARLAIPYHRGYLLHGPPGTGKTSLAKALATHFNLDLWYVPLADIKQEGALMQALSRVSPRSLLLLEDIDTLKISHDRSTESGQINMSSLLNALDGVATPHGLITMMTTNHYDRLDDALVRAGRMDRVEEITYPSMREIVALFEHYFGAAPGRYQHSLNESPGISQAEVSEIFKRHLGDPEAAHDALLVAIMERAASEVFDA